MYLLNYQSDILYVSSTENAYAFIKRARLKLVAFTFSSYCWLVLQLESNETSLIALITSASSLDSSIFPCVCGQLQIRRSRPLQLRNDTRVYTRNEHAQYHGNHAEFECKVQLARAFYK